MRSAKAVLEELEQLGEARGHAEATVERVNDRLYEVLVEAQKHPELTMTEAAVTTGISRPLAYKIIGKGDAKRVESGRPDNTTGHG